MNMKQNHTSPLHSHLAGVGVCVWGGECDSPEFKQPFCWLFPDCVFGCVMQIRNVTKDNQR